VAWVLLNNTSVLSVQDGILTLRFTRDGDLKAFGTSGHDAVLKKVLSADFGLTVTVRGVVGGEAAPGAGGPTPGPSGPRPSAARRQPSAGGSGRGTGSAGPGAGAGSAAPAGPTVPTRQAAPPVAPQESARPESGGRRDEPEDDLPPEPDEPSADDPPAGGPAELSGLDLVQRELGGQVIGEFEG
jgi:DNA polymerase-3 subunit gamma/tau